MKKGDVLEEKFLRLEEIVKTMESGELSLDQSFDLYKEGVKLVQACNASLDKVEKQIKVLSGEEIKDALEATEGSIADGDE
ncbi:MAG: exodeoxyribonuclease VII small subunit [Clostridiales bacterium]|nr:exodeoxyribonuclease VII small subunit [Clostridiales bacterium]MDU1041795.1 exodeoxyribonuclease VII small subunit [Clostridiales bacterium]MDU3489590.1 exodeoxyribonuclease VII small subunit [Clostridiales bacterium]